MADTKEFVPAEDPRDRGVGIVAERIPDEGSTDQPDVRSIRRVLWKDPGRIVALVLIGAYVIARLTILARFAVFTSYDTSSYSSRASGGGLVPTLSFTGHAPRLWGVPLLYEIAPTDHMRAVLQWGIGTVAWVVFGFGLWLHTRSVVARGVALGATFVLALTPSVARWDYAILSESLSISLGVLAMGLFAIWVRSRSRAVLGVMVATVFWWTFTRQDVFLLAALLTVVVAVYGLRHRHRRRWSIAATLVLLAGLGWHAAIVPTIDRSYSSWGKGFRVSEATTLYRLRLLVLKDRRVKAVYTDRFGMPRCRAAERVAERSGLLMGRFTDAFRTCPELVAWVSNNASDNGYRYALEDPKHFARVLLETLPKTLDNDLDVFGEPVPVLPGPASRAVFPAGRFVLPGALGLTASALIVSMWAGGFRRRAWLLGAGAALLLASVGNIVMSLIFGWGDFVRYGIQEAVLLRIGVIIMLVAAVDALLTRNREVARAVTAPAGLP